MKFTLALCIFVALACGTQVHAGIFTDFADATVEKVKSGVDKLIVDAMERIQSAVDRAQENFDKFVVDGQKWTEQTKANVHDKLKSVLDRIDQEIANVAKASKENGVDLSSCEEIAHKVQRNVIELTDEATKCVTEQVDQVAKSLEPLKERVSDMKNVLTEFLKATSQCVSDPKTSTVRNVACLTDNNLKATYEIGKRVPSLVYESTKFTAGALLSPFPTGYCIATNTFVTSVEEAKSMLDSVRSCVDAQLNRNNKNEVESATAA